MKLPRWNALQCSRSALLLISTGIAATPVQAERAWHIGWLGGITQPTIYDPDGPTNVGTQALWKDLVITYERNRDSRFFVEIADQSYSLDASTTDIGQDVSRTIGLLSYQARFRPSRNFKPWIGIGVGYASETYEPRYTKTTTGFLNQRFPDRSESGVVATINATSEWDFVFDTSAGVHLQYEHGLGDLSRLASFSFFINY